MDIAKRVYCRVERHPNAAKLLQRSRVHAHAKCWIAARILSVCVVKTLIRSVTGDY
jgi:hypothetical protein